MIKTNRQEVTMTSNRNISVGIKCDIINDVKLFLTVYHGKYQSHIFDIMQSHILSEKQVHLNHQVSENYSLHAELMHKEHILELNLNTYFTCRTTNNSIPKKMCLSIMIEEVKLLVNIFINYSTGMYVLKIFFFLYLKRPYFSK